MLPDFEFIHKGKYSSFLAENKLSSFHQACRFLANLDYGRTSDRGDFSLLFTEKKGTCSLKHGFLKELCELNQINGIDLIVGIFLMNETYHPRIQSVLDLHQLKVIPEAHCYLRFDGQRYDFTTKHSDVKSFEPYLVREQSCDPNQVVDWKPMIHQHYMGGWIKRNNLDLSIEQLWAIREDCITCFTTG